MQTKSLPSLWPIEGRILSGFAERTDPFSGEGAFHKGVDISAPTGTPIHSTADGIVVSSEPMGGYGRLVIVDHGGGVHTYYAHLSKILVHAGQELHRGDLVGLVGSSGRTTAPHLHYEVRVGGTPMNPYRYLANASVFRQTPKDLPF
jgi:murein DD-endopeptidase MepM/ murein hydrolase activator NlpD